MRIYVYMLRCADGRFYVGSARGDLEHRIAEHNSGAFGGYTARWRPVALVWRPEFEDPKDAVAAERQLKGWSRRKKEALIAGDFDAVSNWAKRPSARQSRD